MPADSYRIRVLVVDDDQMAAAGISAILGAAPDVTVVGNCTSGEHALTAARELTPDVVLCDMRMPGMGGIDVVEALAGAADAPKLLMMTAFDDDGQVLDAVASGAAGFLLKDEDPLRIIEAVRQVHNGDAAFSPRAAGQLTQWVRDSRTADARRQAREKLDLLTEREREFALALVTGASDAELAARFFVAESTVKSALSTIKMKWGIRNRTQLAVIVARSGLT